MSSFGLLNPINESKLDRPGLSLHHYKLVETSVDFMWKKLTLSLVIALFCGYLAFHNVSLTKLKEAMLGIHYSLLLLSIIPMFFSYLFRAWRWQHILAPIKKISFPVSFGITCVGFLAVNTLPLRIGEMAKPILLKNKEEIPFSSGLATITVERIFDSLVITLILVLILMFFPPPLTELPYLKTNVQSLVYFALTIFLPVLAILILMLFFKSAFLYLFEKACSILPKQIARKIYSMGLSFLEGLQSLKGVKCILWVSFHSIMVWGTIALCFHIVLLAFNFQLPFSAALTVLGIVCLGVMLPAAPGFIGNFELFAKAALALYLIEPNKAIAFSLIMHAIQLLFAVAIGLIFLPQHTLKLSTMKTKESKTKGKQDGGLDVPELRTTRPTTETNNRDQDGGDGERDT